MNRFLLTIIQIHLLILDTNRVTNNTIFIIGYLVISVVIYHSTQKLMNMTFSIL